MQLGQGGHDQICLSDSGGRAAGVLGTSGGKIQYFFFVCWHSSFLYCVFFFLLVLMLWLRLGLALVPLEVLSTCGPWPAKESPCVPCRLGVCIMCFKISLEWCTVALDKASLLAGENFESRWVKDARRHPEKHLATPLACQCLCVAWLHVASRATESTEQLLSMLLHYTVPC